MVSGLEVGEDSVWGENPLYLAQLGGRWDPGVLPGVLSLMCPLSRGLGVMALWWPSFLGVFLGCYSFKYPGPESLGFGDDPSVILE